MLYRRIRCGCACAALSILTIACSSSDPPTIAAPSSSTVTSTDATVVVPPSTSSSLVEATTTTEAVRTIEIAFAAGQVTGGARRESVRLGERIRLRVTSDVTDEVHVHTYDVMVAVVAGQPAVLELTATIPGRHEVELENKRKQLLTLEVR